MPFSEFPITQGSSGPIPVEPDTQRIINSLSDFPAPVGGVITLPDPAETTITTYLLGGAIDIGANRIEITSGTSVKLAPVGVSATLTASSSSVAVIDFTDALLIVDFLVIVNLSSVPTFLSSTGAGGSTLTCHRFANIGTPLVADITDSIFVGLHSCQIIGNTNGIASLSGFIGTFTLDGVLVSSSSGTLVDLNSSTISTTFKMSGITLEPNYSGTFISGLANNGNLGPSVIATVTGCNTLASGSGLSGVSRDDTQWLFTGNDGIADSRPEVFISVQGNATETVINTPGVREQITAIFTEVVASQATTTAAGRSTFNNDIPYVGLRCSFSGNARSSSGSPEYEILIFKNGAAISESRVTFENPATQTNNFAVNIPVDVIDGDFFEVFVANLDSTTNITFENIQFSIS